MLSNTITELKKEDVKNHSALLLQIFTMALDYRATQNDKNVMYKSFAKFLIIKLCSPSLPPSISLSLSLSLSLAVLRS